MGDRQQEGAFRAGLLDQQADGLLAVPPVQRSMLGFAQVSTADRQNSRLVCVGGPVDFGGQQIATLRTRSCRLGRPWLP